MTTATITKTMSSTTSKRRTGFFHLPLELRQMIYENFLPLNSIYHVGKARNNDDNHNLCSAHPQLAIEMRNWESLRLQRVGFWVSSTPWRVPAHLRLDKLQHVTIFLRHYSSSGDVTAQLNTMRTNMEHLVKWINDRDTVLPHLRVAFEDDTEILPDSQYFLRYPGGIIERPDEYWCHSFTSHQSSRSTVLHVIDGTVENRSMFEYLLRPLVHLSSCRRLDITLLNKVFDRNYWTQRLTESQLCLLIPRKFRKLDMDHMWTFAETLEAWVEGRISKEKPFGKTWRKYLRAVRERGMRETRESTRHLLTTVEKPEMEKSETILNGWRKF